MDLQSSCFLPFSRPCGVHAVYWPSGLMSYGMVTRMCVVVGAWQVHWHVAAECQVSLHPALPVSQDVRCDFLLGEGKGISCCR